MRELLPWTTSVLAYGGHADDGDDGDAEWIPHEFSDDDEPTQAPKRQKRYLRCTAPQAYDIQLALTLLSFRDAHTASARHRSSAQPLLR